MRKFRMVLFAAVALLAFSLKSKAQASLLGGISDESEYYKFASLVRASNIGADLAKAVTYTVFAPDNTTFREMPTSKMDSLSADPAAMANFLKGHIVKGKLTMMALAAKLTAGKGRTTLVTLSGQTLKIQKVAGNKILLTDAAGNQIHFLAFDIKDPHGVVHGIDHCIGVK
ncbi:fasciclin domain-containing protein [Mucilaginibacter yixingensis]|uniref:Fasciclin domain-containing protein n=1 Tax=Mucilaginibacter yixingensis TaxID=1295612 RepID=A0A2T5JCW7_9SPHI|nr:fasciclin domain-containing protein [Mucilaginibacter yixingensis]PTQ99596.1 fasciclin domain-containing protein [Mucilaginibacter yixingensis]